LIDLLIGPQLSYATLFVCSRFCMLQLMKSFGVLFMDNSA